MNRDGKSPDAGKSLRVGKSLSVGSAARSPRHRFAGSRARSRDRAAVASGGVRRRRMCAPFEPEPVALHSSPKGGTPTAFIRVDQNWSFAPHGGCEGLKVSVHEGAQRHELPTLEFDYEMPGAIVLEQRDRWFKVRLASGSGWIEASPADRFMPLSELFEEFVGVTAITKSFSGRLVAAPGRPAEASSSLVRTLAAGARDRDPKRVRPVVGAGRGDEPFDLHAPPSTALRTWSAPAGCRCTLPTANPQSGSRRAGVRCLEVPS